MKALTKSHTHCQVARKADRTNQNLSISMSSPTLQKTKYDRTTKAILHAALSW